MEISVNQLAELLGLAVEKKGGQVYQEINPFSEFFGKNVFIRTVTHHYTGHIEKLVGKESCILTTAAWIADSGRFYNALSLSKFDEVEPYPGPVQINYSAVLDMSEIKELPKEQK